MKKFISVALAFVMVMCLFPGCGAAVQPAGTYADQFGTSIVEIGAYDAKEETGSFKMTNTLNEDILLEGSYTLEVCEADISSWVDVTLTDGTTMTFLYDVTMDVLQDQSSLINYFGPNASQEEAPAA